MDSVLIEGLGRSDGGLSRGTDPAELAPEAHGSQFPNIISHIKYSWRIGYPKRLVIWRKGADQRRDQLLQGIPTKRGFDRDEAPAAVLRKKVQADVRYVPSGENRSAGASLGEQISGYCNGIHIGYRFTP